VEIDVDTLALALAKVQIVSLSAKLKVVQGYTYSTPMILESHALGAQIAALERMLKKGQSSTDSE